MCNDRSWKTCSIATIVFSTLLMLGMFIGVGVMNAMFANNMRCYRDVNSNGYVRCGTSWGNYILAASGARDCTGCGEAITSYTDCEIAASSGWTAHLTGVLMGSASWSSGAAPPGRGGPRGCHIQEGSKGSNMDGAPDWSKFEFNANVDGTSAVGYYTPVCRGAYRRELFEEMHHIAAQHPSGDGVARVKLALSNIAQTFGLGAAMKLPAVLSPEGRKLTEAIPNDDSCGYFSSDGDCDDGGLCSCGTDLSDCGYRFSSDSCGSISPPPPYNPGYIPNDDSCGYPFSSDGACDDGSTGGYALCSCGTDLSDCGYRFSSDSCYHRGKTANESVEKIEKDVLDVFNPSIIVPAIVCALFLYLGSGLTLCKPACGGMAVLISGAVFSLLSLPIFSVMVFIYLFYANIVLEVIKTSWDFHGDCSGYDAESGFCKCIEDSQAMFSSAGVGCLIACIGCLGGFISAICASCGICKAQKKAKAESLTGPGTQMGAIQGQGVAVGQPMTVVAVAQPL